MIVVAWICAEWWTPYPSEPSNLEAWLMQQASFRKALAAHFELEGLLGLNVVRTFLPFTPMRIVIVGLHWM